MYMAREGKGRVVPVGKAKTRYVTVPADVAGDSAFPFVDGERVTIQIEGEEIRISRAAPDRGEPHA